MRRSMCDENATDISSCVQRAYTCAYIHVHILLDRKTYGLSSTLRVIEIKARIIVESISRPFFLLHFSFLKRGSSGPKTSTEHPNGAVYQMIYAAT